MKKHVNTKQRFDRSAVRLAEHGFQVAGGHPPIVFLDVEGDSVTVMQVASDQIAWKIVQHQILDSRSFLEKCIKGQFEIHDLLMTCVDMKKCDKMQ